MKFDVYGRKGADSQPPATHDQHPHQFGRARTTAIAQLTMRQATHRRRKPETLADVTTSAK